MEQAVGLFALMLFLALMTQRWFWALVFLIAALAAGFTMLACIVHFQIIEAVGLFFVATICMGISMVILDHGQ